MEINIETITPEVAQQILSTNTHNRELNKRHVMFLCDQMQSGLWQMAADPIRISDTGVLLDGQHRLSAIVASKVTYDMLVVRGLPDTTFHVMDTGRIRSAGDVLQIGGHPNSRLIASIIRMVINYHRGNFSNTLANMGRVSGYTVTNGEIMAFAAETDMQPFVHQAKAWYRAWPMFTGSEYGFFYFILSNVDTSATIEFFDALTLGADLPADSPLFQLRKKMDQYKFGAKKVSSTPTERLGLVLKAWNLYRKGKTVSYLTFNKDKEDVPSPI